MTPKEKAFRLLMYFESILFDNEEKTDNKKTKQCALICVDEILESHYMSVTHEKIVTDYWQDVKKEIENL